MLVRDPPLWQNRRAVAALESSDAPDVGLLQRIAARDPVAVADLYDRYSRLLFSVIVRILRSRPDAEEVLQEVFVRVWVRADMYDESLGTPGAWLVRVARNRAIDRLRARRTSAADVPASRSETDCPSDGADGSTPEALTLMAETGETVREALAALPAEQRTLIEAAFFDGYTHSELAERYTLPLGTVKTRIRAGMTRLRQRLEQVV
jgi:RNA polymerase sigma-70 factor (ECF subfamily)